MIFTQFHQEIPRVFTCDKLVHVNPHIGLLVPKLGHTEKYPSWEVFAVQIMDPFFCPAGFAKYL